MRFVRLVALTVLALPATARAFDLILPTPNTALFRPGAEAEFFQPTIEGTLESGRFGCVRRGGRRFHEGIDIKCTQHDRRGEPIDPVRAASAGRVAFINDRPGLSNYGRYVMLEHRWDDVEVFTLYAHLREVAGGLKVGTWVPTGERLGTLGHSTNTREGISADRAHLHFEVGLMLNPQFRIWYPRHEPKAPPFGNFNGQNFDGLDPADLLRAVHANPNLNFAAYLAAQPVAFTVLVRADRLPFARTHAAVVTGNERAVAYEVGVTVWGMPVRVAARSPDPVAGRRLPALNTVDEAVLAAGNCRGLIEKRGRGWQLAPAGRDWLELLTFVP